LVFCIKEENRLRVPENKALRRAIGFERGRKRRIENNSVMRP
jgi:hypothetical protein